MLLLMRGGAPDEQLHTTRSHRSSEQYARLYETTFECESMYAHLALGRSRGISQTIGNVQNLKHVFANHHYIAVQPEATY